MIEQDQYEISLNDIWLTIKKYHRLILAMPIALAVIAYILVSFVMHPKWEGTAILQIGQIGGEIEVQSGQIGEGKALESVGNMIARIHNPSFADGVLKQVNFKPEDISISNTLFENSLKITKIKDSDFVEIKLRGYSPDTVRTMLMNIINFLQKEHEQILSAGVTRIKRQLQSVNENIASLKSESDNLKRRLLGKHDWSSYDATLSATVLLGRETQLRELEQKKLLLIEQINPSQTFNTKIIGDVSVTGGPVSPRKFLIIGIAILIGIFGGLLVAFVHNAISNVKEQ